LVLFLEIPASRRAKPPVNQTFHRWLIEGDDTRLIGDYHVDTKIEMDAVADMINQVW
jgi:hypothetical protein